MKYFTDRAIDELSSHSGSPLDQTCRIIFNTIFCAQDQELSHYFDLETARDLFAAYSNMKVDKKSRRFDEQRAQVLLQRKYEALVSGDNKDLRPLRDRWVKLDTTRYNRLEQYLHDAIVNGTLPRKTVFRKYVHYCGAALPAMRAMWGICNKVALWDDYRHYLVQRARFWKNLPNLTSRLWLGFDME